MYVNLYVQHTASFHTCVEVAEEQCSLSFPLLASYTPMPSSVSLSILCEVSSLDYLRSMVCPHASCGTGSVVVLIIC